MEFFTFALHKQKNMKKFSLGFFPTPIHPLSNLSKKLGNHQIFIKRDDQTGLASGGNKTRKLEFLVADAIQQGCDTIVTLGAQQSNHCRQTAAACAVAGLNCTLVVRGAEPNFKQGNLLMSYLLGAVVHYAGGEISEEFVSELLDNLTKEGKKPYLVPYGGSNNIGILGFVEAMHELKGQISESKVEFDYIFFASCSGGTQAGLTIGKKLFGTTAKLMPVSIQKPEGNTEPLEKIVIGLCNQGNEILSETLTFCLEDVELVKGYDEAGYGVLTENERSAIIELATTEGIILDPVYTGRAFHAMTDLLKRDALKPNSKILFWHTGGLPANFEYASQLV